MWKSSRYESKPFIFIYMEIFRRITWLVFLLVISATTIGYFFWYKPKFHPAKAIYFAAASIDVTTKSGRLLALRLKQKASDIRGFAVANDLNHRYCFLIDMDISSGKNRFFVYNMVTDSVEMAGLVTHGSGSVNDGNTIKFSNVAGSNCSSLGKYRIGKPYEGKFGLAYKLYGLDNTNSKAFERFVVLHAHSCVPGSEVYPLTICESWGCPTVSPGFLQSLKKYIDDSENPILLNIDR